MATKREYRFPGMDPWLETPGYWTSVHDALIIHLAEALTRMLAPRYLAWSGQRTVLEITDRKPKPDPDAVVDLQSLVEEVYEAGGFGYGVDYGRPPVPPLDAEDLAWARGVLKGRGRNGRR